MIKSIWPVYEKSPKDSKRIKTNKNKSTFMQSSVEYLGHVIDANGVHLLNQKLQLSKKHQSQQT